MSAPSQPSQPPPSTSSPPAKFHDADDSASDSDSDVNDVGVDVERDDDDSDEDEMEFNPPTTLPSPPSTTTIYFRSDFDKSVLLHNFVLRHWRRSDPNVSHFAPTNHRDWNFFWGSVTTIKAIFNPDVGGYRLVDSQIVNHFPNHFELTRKDLMVKNIKRYRRELEYQFNQSLLGGHPHSAHPTPSISLSMLSAKDSEGNYIYLDLFPTTFILPSDYSLFIDEFKRNPNSIWIMKPNSKSQGYGISIINKVGQIKKFYQQKYVLTQTTTPQLAASTSSSSAIPGQSSNASPYVAASSSSNSPPSRELFVISRYITNPLLIGSKKFDLRLYVLVTTYRPLRCYLYDDGFARFCNVPYSFDAKSFDNQYVHLTNVAIQKLGPQYNAKHGNKWSTHNLKLYLQSRYESTRVEQLFHSIHFIIIHSLKAVQHVMLNDKHCFECYGFDLLIDSTLRPWLLEINASPSLSVTTPADRRLKMNLIRDILRVVIPPAFPDPSPERAKGTSWNNTDVKVGGFQLIYDESLVEKEKDRERNE